MVFPGGREETRDHWKHLFMGIVMGWMVSTPHGEDLFVSLEIESSTEEDNIDFVDVLMGDSWNHFEDHYKESKLTGCYLISGVLFVAGAGSGDDNADTGFAACPVEGTSKPAATWIGTTAADTFKRVEERTLNLVQTIALGLICEALDEQQVNDADRQHLKHGGEGGLTSNSWLISEKVFAAKKVSSRLVITAVSGTATAGIGGTTTIPPYG
ncbi:hypothetical protein ColLi_09104 [Colletotrichum liriopes]|uniref:Uncharacterized protein n=1 Tax=Colletotrichum liriopes TaxID=708192 RepID=A0AA37GS69_9PEZI|nr:hypothetical protein ColLi_09104 [Colletotrichum liriopes]